MSVSAPLGFSYYLSLICWAHLWMLALCLLLKKQHFLSDKFFAAFLFSFSFIHIQHVLLPSGLLVQFPFFDPICGIVLSAVGPLFYFYVRTTVGKQLTKSDYWHAIVLLPGIVHFIFLLFTKNATDLNAYYYTKNQQHTQYTLTNVLLLTGMLVYFMTYMFACVKELNAYSKKLKETYSNVEKLKLNWLRDLIFMLIGLSFIIGPTILYLADFEHSRLALSYFSTFIYFIIIYKSFNSSVLFIPELLFVKKPAVLPVVKYINSTLPASTIQELGSAIQQFLNTNPLLYEEQLNLAQVAGSLAVPPHVLSEVINRFFDKSFFDVVNEARVEKAKQQLQDVQNLNLTVEGIGYNCGFGSKASFYRSFKKFTGITPKEYLKVNMLRPTA